MPFPNTSILDNFNRADTGPPPSASWATATFGYGPPGYKVYTNRCAPDVGGPYGGSFASQYWTTQFGPDAEVYLTTVSGFFNTFDLYVRGSSSAFANCYLAKCDFTAGNAKIYRHDAGVKTQLGATVTQSFANGDSIGLMASGTTISLWLDAGTTGSWTLLAERLDTTYVTSGYIGIYTDDYQATFDNFGGGTILSPAFSPPARRFQHMLIR